MLVVVGAAPSVRTATPPAHQHLTLPAAVGLAAHKPWRTTPLGLHARQCIAGGVALSGRATALLVRVPPTLPATVSLAPGGLWRPAPLGLHVRVCTAVGARVAPSGRGTAMLGHPCPHTACYRGLGTTQTPAHYPYWHPPAPTPLWVSQWMGVPLPCLGAHTPTALLPRPPRLC